MLPLGILSIIQAVFLPGIVVGFWVRDLRWIDRALLAVPLSLVFNYILVLCLTLAGLYNRPAMFFVVVIELLLLLAITVRKIRTPSLNVHHGSPSLIKSLVLQPMELFIGGLVLVSVALFSSEAWSQLGTVFTHWDAVVSWNRWAVTWFHGELPHGTWQYPYGSQTYPQGVPILYSMTYQFIGDARVQFFAKAIAIAMPFAALATFLRMAFLVKAERGIMFLSVPIFIMLLANGYGHDPSFMFSGFVDPVIAYFGVLVCYLFALMFQRMSPEKMGMWDDNFIYVAVIVASTAALIKQTGVIVAFLIPLAWFYYFGRHAGARGRIRLFWLYLIVAVLAGHWYIYKAIQIYQGIDASFLTEYNSLIPTKWYLRPFSAAELIFSTYGWSWLIPFVFGFRLSAIRVLAVWGILPVFLFWAFFISYDLRGLYLAMPWIAIVWSAGCFSLYEIARTRRLHLALVGLWLIAFLFEVKGKLGDLFQSATEFSIYVFFLSALFLLLIQLIALAYFLAPKKNFHGKIALALVSILSLVTTIWCIRFSSDVTSQELINKSITDQRAIGSPELNQYLLKRFSGDGGSGYFASANQLTGFIPGLQERFQVAQCDEFTFLSDPAIRYYLHMTYCPPIAREELERRLGGGYIALLRENQDHNDFYEIHR